MFIMKHTVTEWDFIRPHGFVLQVKMKKFRPIKKKVEIEVNQVDVDVKSMSTIYINIKWNIIYMLCLRILN